MDAKTIILGFLMKQNMTGYELKKAFSISFSFFSGLSYGSIYPALKKMESQGLITMQREIQEGLPNKKVYTITEQGRETFLSQLRSKFKIDQMKSVFLSRLFFFSYLSREERIELAHQYLASIQEQNEKLQYLQPEIQTKADPFQYECFMFGVRMFSDIAKNVGLTIEKLKAME